MKRAPAKTVTLTVFTGSSCDSGKQEANVVVLGEGCCWCETSTEQTSYSFKFLEVSTMGVAQRPS